MSTTKKKCTVHRDQDTVENATSANQDIIENATSANQGTIENATNADTPTEGIYSLISQENIRTIYDTDTEYEGHQNNEMSATNEPNNANYSMITFESLTSDKKHQDNIQHAPDNYSMITFESLKTHQDIQHDLEPLDIPDWGEGDMMTYQGYITSSS